MDLAQWKEMKMKHDKTRPKGCDIINDSSAEGGQVHLSVKSKNLILASDFSRFGFRHQSSHPDGCLRYISESIMKMFLIW